MMICRLADRSHRYRAGAAPCGDPVVRVAPRSPWLRQGSHHRRPPHHDRGRRDRRGVPRVERCDARGHRRQGASRRARRGARRSSRVVVAPPVGARSHGRVPDLAGRGRRRGALGPGGARPGRAGAPAARNLPGFDPGVCLDDDVRHRRGVPRRRRPVPRARVSGDQAPRVGRRSGGRRLSASGCATTSGPTST